MNYLLGNFDKYALDITENLFSLHMVKLDKNSGEAEQSRNRKQRIQPPAPPEPPVQTQTQANGQPLTNEQRRLMIEALLGKREASDSAGSQEKDPSGTE